MAVCSDCLDPTCGGHAANVVCSNAEFINLSTHRNANGDYSLALRALLPVSAQTLPNGLIDASTGYQQPLNRLTILSAAAEAFRVHATFPTNVVTGTALTMAHAVSIYRNFDVHRPAIMERLEDLNVMVNDDNEARKLDAAIKACKRVLDDTRLAAPKLASTPDELEHKNFPRASILLQLTQFYMMKRDMSALCITHGAFDEKSGGAVTKFAKIKVVTCPEMKNRIFRDLFEVFCKLKGGGGRSQWQPLFEQLDSLSEAGHEPQFVHMLLFTCLKKIDSSPAIDIVNFMSQHWLLCFSMFQTTWLRENEASSGKPRPWTDTSGVNTRHPGRGGGRDQGGQGNATINPVTKQGEWVENPEKKTYDGTKVCYCNRFNQNRPCNVGCASGPDKGKCIFVHRCSWCDSSAHYGAEKKSGAAGGFVCPKHP